MKTPKSKPKSPKLHLFRVDLNLKYLFLTTKEKYGSQADIMHWLKNHMHEGELDNFWEDEDTRMVVEEVADTSQIEDFSKDYSPYSPDDLYDESLQERSLESLIPELNLDSAEMIRILKSRGYKIEQPKK